MTSTRIGRGWRWTLVWRGGMVDLRLGNTILPWASWSTVNHHYSWRTGSDSVHRCRCCTRNWEEVEGEEVGENASLVGRRAIEVSFRDVGDDVPTRRMWMTNGDGDDGGYDDAR